MALWQALRDWVRTMRVFSGGRVRSKTKGGPSVAVVLGAQVLRGGSPSGTLSARTLHAARMYEAGSVDIIVVTGGVGECPPSEAEVMAEILTGAGVPEGVVVREPLAKSTWDSAVYVSRMMRAEGVYEVYVVTDPLHCVRTVAAFEESGLRAAAEPVYGSPSWRIGRMRAGQLLREMGASLWYRVHHGVGSRIRR